MSSSVCRVCLTDKLLLRPMNNDFLISVYEKLSKCKFNSDDGRPRAMCCYCYQKLLKCHSFSEMARRSEQILSQLCQNGKFLVTDDISENKFSIKQQLSVSPMKIFTNDTTNEIPPVTHEIEQISVKIECFTENDSYSETDPSSMVFIPEALIKREYVEEDSQQNISAEDYLNIDDEKKLVKQEEIYQNLRECHESLNKQQSAIGSQFENLSHLEEIIPRSDQFNIKPHDNNQTIKTTCCVCKKQFRQKSSLLNHLRIHTGDKPFPCTVCEKKFSRKSHLNTHMKVHTGEKPYTCSICNMQCSEKSNLIKHMRIHTGEKPYKCSVCKKKFIHKSNLTQHMKVHTKTNVSIKSVKK